MQLSLGGDNYSFFGFGDQSLGSVLAHGLDQGVMARTTHMTHKIQAKFGKPGIAIQYSSIGKAR